DRQFSGADRSIILWRSRRCSRRHTRALAPRVSTVGLRVGSFWRWEDIDPRWRRCVLRKSLRERMEFADELRALRQAAVIHEHVVECERCRCRSRRNLKQSLQRLFRRQSLPLQRDFRQWWLDIRPGAEFSMAVYVSVESFAAKTGHAESCF